LALQLDSHNIIKKKVAANFFLAFQTFHPIQSISKEKLLAKVERERKENRQSYHDQADNLGDNKKKLSKTERKKKKKLFPNTNFDKQWSKKELFVRGERK
jgi:Fe-S cluster assembly ATPase SufC